MKRNAEIISVGTELLLGSTTNTVVWDNPQRLKSAVAIARIKPRTVGARQ